MTERSKSVISQSQWAHTGRDGRRLARARGAGGSRTVPRVNSRAPELTLTVPADGATRKVRAANGDSSGRLQAFNDRSISTRIGVGQCPQALSSWRASDVEIVFHREGHAVEGSQVSTGGNRAVSRLGRLQRLLGHDDDNRVARVVDRLDPPQVCP